MEVDAGQLLPGGHAVVAADERMGPRSLDDEFYPGFDEDEDDEADLAAKRPLYNDGGVAMEVRDDGDLEEVLAAACGFPRQAPGALRRFGRRHRPTLRRRPARAAPIGALPGPSVAQSGLNWSDRATCPRAPRRWAPCGAQRGRGAIICSLRETLVPFLSSTARPPSLSAPHNTHPHPHSLNQLQSSTKPPFPPFSRTRPAPPTHLESHALFETPAPPLFLRRTPAFPSNPRPRRQPRALGRDREDPPGPPWRNWTRDRPRARRTAREFA